MLVGLPPAALSRCGAALGCLRRPATTFRPLRYLLRRLWWRVERLGRRVGRLSRRVERLGLKDRKSVV